MTNALLWIAVLTAVVAGPVVRAAAGAEPGGVAVVELFTSEGCSSCPPADAAVADLIHDTAGRPVFVLAFHVDYWDELGWKDPFAANAYTRRQQQYAHAFRLGSLYTPQAVVNGQREFVGSDRAKLKQAVEAVLGEPAPATLKASVAVRAEGVLNIAVTSLGLAAGSNVNVAVVQRGITSVVSRGENGGRTFTHDNVVRAFAALTPDGSGHAATDLRLPADAKRADLSVIVYAARPDDGKVLAATESKLP